MKVKCNRAALFEALQLASSIVPARTPKAILQCAKLEATKDKLIVTATDSEVSVKCAIGQVQIESSGSVLIPAERMTGILRETSDESISLEVLDTTCEVVGRDSRFRLRSDDPKDFPEIRTDKGESEFVINAGELKGLIRRVVFAAARESTRYAINGVLWEQKGKKLRMVATDGRRLAQVDGDLASVKTEMKQSAIVPVKAMMILERVLHDPQEKITILFSGNQVMFQAATVEVTGTLIQGRFPKYEDVIPSDCENRVIVEAAAFENAVRRAALLTNEQSRGVGLSFSQGKILFSSSSPEVGEAEVNMKVEYNGKEVEIGFNPQYLLDVFRVIDEKEVTFEFGDNKKPGVLRCGKAFLYVVMPVMV